MPFFSFLFFSSFITKTAKITREHLAKEPEMKVLCEILDFTVLLSFFKPRTNGIIITTISAQKLSPDVQVSENWVQKVWIYPSPTHIHLHPAFVCLVADHCLMQHSHPPLLPRATKKKLFHTHFLLFHCGFNLSPHGSIRRLPTYCQK